MSVIYKTIEQWQGTTPWGRFLDAGTGEQSLTWVQSIAPESVVAITGSQDYASELKRKLPQSESLHLIADNWTNGALLQDEVFDTVMADYLLGAVDGFSPYFQGDLFSRLKRHLAENGTLYVIGLEPIPDYSDNKGDRLLIRLSKLRDACILLAGHRCYREFPLEWVQSKLVESGFNIIKTKPFFNQFGMPYVTSQLTVARSKLSFIQDSTLVAALSDHIQALETDLETHINAYGPISLGFDYLIQARLKEAVT